MKPWYPAEHVDKIFSLLSDRAALEKMSVNEFSDLFAREEKP